QDGESYSSVLYEATMAQDGKNVARACREGVSRDFRYDSDDLLWKTIINSVQSGQTANTDFCRELSYDAFRDDVAGAMFKDGETIREEHSYGRPSQSYKTNHFGDIAGRLRVSHEISTRTTSLGIHDGSGYADVMTSQESAHSVTREYDNVHSHGGGYQSVGEAFDDYGFPTSISYGGVTMATFSYAENFASRYCSLPEEATDLFSGRDVSIVYGDDNEVSSITVGGFTISYYKDSGGLSCAEYSFGPDESYVCKADASQAFALEGSATVGPTLWSYSYDSLGRVSSKSDGAIPFGLTQTYSYSSDFPSRVSGYSLGGLLGLHYAESYSYGDAYGNLTGVSASSPSVSYGSSYQFDGLGRIVSETNNVLGISRTYQYESFGDHASGPVGRMVSFGNASMEYDEKGRLLQFGSDFYSYDHYGNRVSKNQVSYQWERGTLLSYCGLSRFEYDYRGLRSLKVDASGLTHEYFYDGERLVGEDVRDGSSTVRKLRYFYDLDGLCALRVIVGDTKSDYVCIRNPLGDIVALSEGHSIKVTYVYDAWGNHKAYDQYGVENTSPSFIGNVNPFRYRGYYFDSDTGLYYLRARYYDPEIGQFISPDDVGYMDFESIGGLNLYAYCNYNPVMYSDPSGRMPEWLQWVVGGALIIGAVAITIATAGVGGAIATALGGGFLASVFGGAVAGAAVGALSGAMIGAGTELITNGFEGFNWSAVGYGALSGLITGAIAGGVFGGISYVFKSTTIARVASQLDAAEYDLTHSLGTLKSIPTLSKAPFASTNIAKAVTNAIANYNSAYSGLIMAKSMYYFYYGITEAAYFLGESWLAYWLGNYF
nr:RHS repeat-associated core domain-containing protein [Bacilli bacterium]